MRVQIQRQRGEIRQLQKAGIPTTSGEACASLRTWYDDNADNPPWIKALAEVRRLAPREGWRYQHVQAIIVSIDQYAEAALGNREFFLNKPYGIGGGMKDNIP